jgi:hypothetical protein
VRFVAITFIVIATLLLIFSFTTARNRKTAFGPALGADFASFYIAGQILNSPETEKLYDLPLQDQLYHELLPEASEDETLSFPYAPFLAVLVRPLALAPYEVAFGAWLVINLACYILGFLLLWRSNPDLTEHSIRTPLLVAVSFTPFLLEGWIGGQSVGLIMLILGFSIYLHSKGRHWEGGVILSLCLFKPTLLVLVVPMLLSSGKLKMFAGYLMGAFALLGVSWAAVGMEGLRGYVNLLRTYAAAKVSAPNAFRTEKYVDLTSFARLLSLPESVMTIGVGLVSLAIFFLLCRAWWGARRLDMRSFRTTWACSLIWTPLLAPQCAIYDSALAVAAFVLIASVHPLATPTRDTDSKSGYTMWATLTYCSAFLTVITAFGLGFQLLTIVLFGAGLWMLRVTHACLTLEGAHDAD